MIKRGLLIIILILFSSAVYSIEQFSGFLYADEDFLVGDQGFYIMLSNDEDLIVFKSGVESINVKKGDCKSTINYKYCFYEAIVDFDRNLGKLHDYTGEEMPALNISVISLKPDIKITRAISKPTPYEYEETEVMVVLTNDGKKEALVYYEEEITSPARIIRCNDCIIENNKIIHKSLVYPSDDSVFSYTINPANINSLILSPNISFESKTQNGTISANIITISPKKALELTFLGDKTLNIESEGEAIIKFKNNDPTEQINFVSELEYDDDLLFYSDDAKNENNKLIFTGSLKSFEEKEFEINYFAKKSGNKNMVFLTDYKLNYKELKTNTTVTIEKNIQKPEFIINMDQDFFSDNQNNINLLIDNTESKNSFKNLYIKIKVDSIIEEEFIIPFLKFSRDLIVYDKNFTLLTDIENTSHATINIEYLTLFDEIITQEIKKEIKIRPLKSVLTLEHVIEDHEQEEGDLIINSFIKNNNADHKIILDISETVYDAQVLTNDGRNIEDYTRLLKNQDMHITPLSKKQVYSYILRKDIINNPFIKTKIYFDGLLQEYYMEIHSIIDFNEKTSTIINTTIKKLKEAVIEKIENDEDSGILTENIELENTHQYDIEEKIEEITQEQKEPEEKIINNEQETNNEEQNNPIEEVPKKKKNFFQKILDIILSFF